ncbi:hypothetical protein NL676_012450 [Syzygium grande]|nr:hypothetical protein NL676_012450 [Syzygium grande]
MIDHLPDYQIHRSTIFSKAAPPASTTAARRSLQLLQITLLRHKDITNTKTSSSGINKKETKRHHFFNSYQLLHERVNRGGRMCAQAQWRRGEGTQPGAGHGRAEEEFVESYRAE